MTLLREIWNHLDYDNKRDGEYPPEDSYIKHRWSQSSAHPQMLRVLGALPGETRTRVRTAWLYTQHGTEWLVITEDDKRKIKGQKDDGSR